MQAVSDKLKRLADEWWRLDSTTDVESKILIELHKLPLQERAEALQVVLHCIYHRGVEDACSEYGSH